MATAQDKTGFVLIPFLKDVDVPIHARITLGGIIYRNRLGRGATISGLAKRLGFDRNTIKRHLQKLAPYVYSEDGQWYAKCPLNNPLEFRYVWKSENRTTAQWCQAIRTIKAKSLPLPITPEWQRVIVPLVLYDVLGFSKARQSKAGLAKMLGIGRPTVDRALARLVSHDLIAMTPIKGRKGITSYEIKVLSAKEKLQVKEEVIEEVESPIEHDDPRVLRELGRTLAFLAEECGGQPTIEQIRRFIQTGSMRLWVMSGKVSHFYLCLSPLINRSTMGSDYCCDPGLYEPRISDTVRQSFRETFAYECAP